MAKLAFQKCYTTLKDIRHSLEQVADEAFSKGLIARTLKDKCHDIKSFTEEERTGSLLNAIQDRVTAEPEAIKKFAKILQCTVGAEYIGNQLLQAYDDTKSELVVSTTHCSAPLPHHSPSVVDGMGSKTDNTDSQTHNPVAMEDGERAMSPPVDNGGEQEMRENPPLPAQRSSMGTLIHPPFTSLPATPPFVSLKPEDIPPTTPPTDVKEEDVFPKAKEVPQAKDLSPQEKDLSSQAKDVFPLAGDKEATSEHASLPESTGTSSHPSLPTNVDEAASVPNSTAPVPPDVDVLRSSSSDSDYFMAETCLNCAELRGNLLKSQKSISESQEMTQTLNRKLKSATDQIVQLQHEKEELKGKITELTQSVMALQKKEIDHLRQDHPPPHIHCKSNISIQIQGGQQTLNVYEKSSKIDSQPVTVESSEVAQNAQGADNSYFSFPKGHAHVTEECSHANGTKKEELL